MTQWNESEQTPGDNERQGSLEGCSSWGRKELNTASEQQMTAYLIYIWKHPEGRESWGRGKEREDVYFGHLICLIWYVQGH